VPLAGKDQLVAQFSTELAALVKDPARVRALGAAARDHALRSYTWDTKARQIVEVYQWVLRQRADKPAFDY